jgi:hypothetical protein
MTSAGGKAMTSNQIGERVPIEKRWFWKRQFAGNSTEPQLVFDIAFGLVAPILCFFFDPIVFKGGLMGPPILQPYQLFVYAVTALEVSLLAGSMLFGRRLGTWSRVIGGALISGSVVSAVIGVTILPYSLMGLAVAIGLLGFIPFVTAFVYLRAGWRALKNEDKKPAASLAGALLAGAILSLGIPALVGLYVSRSASHSIDTILHGNTQQAEIAVGHLRWLPFIPQQNLEPLVQSYLIEKDPNRKVIIKNSYQALTGEDIEIRIGILND